MVGPRGRRVGEAAGTCYKPGKEFNPNTMLIDRDSRIVESRLDTSGGDGSQERTLTVVESSGAVRTPPLEAAWLQIVGPADTRQQGLDDTGIFPHEGKGD